MHVRPHTGPTNAKLTVHYGLDVPAGAAIRVADETRPFEARGESGGIRDARPCPAWRTCLPPTGVGVACAIRALAPAHVKLVCAARLPGLLVFDDSFEHEVWQNGSVERTTLVIHVPHPDLRGGNLAEVL